MGYTITSVAYLQVQVKANKTRVIMTQQNAIIMLLQTIQIHAMIAVPQIARDPKELKERTHSLRQSSITLIHQQTNWL